MEDLEEPSVEDVLREKLALAEAKARNAERRLSAAKSELLLLAQSGPDEQKPEQKSESKPATSHETAVLKQRVEALEATNSQLVNNCEQLQKELDDKIQAVENWRMRHLQSELDNSALSGRADLAEDMLAEAVQPLPRDAQQYVKEREMAWLALTDKLTELGNSNKLDLSLAEMINAAYDSDQLVLLMMLNLDGFRTHNEFVGWSNGDELLKQVGERLRSNLPSSTVVARRGADDFAVLTSLERPTGPAATIETPLVRTRQIADLLLRTLAHPFELAGQRIPVTCSIGISVHPDDADTPQEMLENAYAALVLAKRAGGAQYALYNEGIYADKEHRASVAAELRAAVEASALKMLFRPVVETERGKLGAAIVEPYWEHGSHGRVGQHVFLPIAEEQGVAPLVVDQILGSACELSRKLRSSVPTVLRLPASVLRQADFVKKLLGTVTQARIKPESLIVEMSARTLIQAPDKLRAFFNELAKWRIGRCIGQLGESPLDLGALQESQASLLSLSEKLMENVPSHEPSKTLVQTYLDVGKRMNLPVLVGGARDNSQSHFLALHGVHYVAGDFLSPTLSLDDFVNRRRSTWTLR